MICEVCDGFGGLGEAAPCRACNGTGYAPPVLQASWILEARAVARYRHWLPRYILGVELTDWQRRVLDNVLASDFPTVPITRFR